jgi:hypothetical protein
VLGPELALLTSPAVRPSLPRLAETLNDHPERRAEPGTRMIATRPSSKSEVDKTREAIIDVYGDLRRAMLDDLGTRRRRRRA